MRSVYREWGGGIISVPPICYYVILTFFYLSSQNFGVPHNCFQASRFRNLLGNMSPPEDNNRAEIYVEVSSMKFVVLASGVYPTTRTRID